MCGFAGVVTRRERYRTSRETLGRMSAAIAHRGPDAEGIFFNHEAEVTSARPQCALAFRRLSIIDCDARSNQPFTINSRTLVFNGEIYNFRELRDELTTIRPDYPWRTSGDSEVLLMAYDVWGESCVEHLNGMFAFAVWDEATHSLYLARDRMGQKPLFYTVGAEQIAFASELSALKALSFWNEVGQVDDESLVTYLNLGYIDGERTVYDGVRQLPPATWLRWNRQERYAHQYFDRISANEESTGESISPRRTGELVRRAVERQLLSDVPLGIFLSGGVDSSIIAACARRHGPVQTFSIGFDDPRYDETPFAQQVADHLGTLHHTFRVRPNVIDDLPKLARSIGQPFADSSALPTHYLSRETRRHVTVALSGDGSDELFGGYDRYAALHLTEKIPHQLRWAMSHLATTLPPGHPKSYRNKIRRLLQDMHESAASRYAGYVELFDRSLIDALRGRPVSAEKWAAEFDWLEKRFTSIADHYHFDAVQTAAALDRSGYLPDDLLTKVDRCSMLHALEVRSPFMDHELVKYASTSTTDQMLRGGGKRMLREAFADNLPESVFKRKKMGFAVPIGDWFRGELRPMLRETLLAVSSFARTHFDLKVVERLIDEHERSRVDHSHRLYALLMLELWWRDQ